jgi:DNA-binding response OmpR family regulator
MDGNVRLGNKPTMTQTRILLVDDDDPLRAILAQALKQQGYAVQEAVNGKEALDWYDLQGADIVILDVVMPEKEGLETIVELKQRPRIPGIIVISGGGQISPKVYLRIAKAHRADRVLEKPFSCEDLLNTVAEVEKLYMSGNLIGTVP